MMPAVKDEDLLRGVRVSRDNTRTNRWMYAAVAIAAAVFFYLHLFRFPLVPIWHTGDAAIYLEHADRMLHGEVLYRDIFEFNLPGMEWLYLLAFRCFGVHVWVPNALLVAAGTAVTVLVYGLARRVLQGPSAVLPGLAYLLVCQRSSIDGAHHWYSTLLVLAAANVVARVRLPAEMAVAGVLLGMATVVTSTRGVAAAAGVAVFLLWSEGGRRALRPLAALLAGFCVPVAATLGYLAMRVDAGTLWYALVVFPLRYYGKGAANSFSVYFDEWHGMFPWHGGSVLLAALWLAINLATPVVLAIWAVRLACGANADDAERRRSLMLLTCVGVFALAAVASAPSSPRLNCAAAFAYVLGAVLLELIGGRRAVSGMLTMLLLAYAVEASATVLRPLYGTQGPRGEVGFLDRENYEVIDWLNHHARPGDGYFGWPMVNWIVGLQNPAAIEWAEPNAYTRPEQVRALIAALEQKQTRFLDPVDDAVEPRNPDDSLEPLRAYLKTHYHVGHTFADGGTVLERNNVNARAGR
jgi:hypothetical protein